MKFGEDLGRLMNQNPNSAVLRHVDGLILDNMTTKEQIRYFKGFCKATGRNRLSEVIFGG